MRSEAILFFCLLCFLDYRVGNTLKAVSKIDFNDESSESKATNLDLVETFDPSSSNESPNKADLKSDIVCNNNKCVFTYNGNDDASELNQRKISTDVHVRVTTNVKESPQTIKKESEDDDVPIFVGYAGVNPKDINKKNIDDEGKLKQLDKDIEVPSLILETPKYEPRNWYEYLSQNGKPTTTTTKKPILSNGGHVFYPYEIGQSGENVIPPGWSSGWKPIAVNPSSDDYYHYNVNQKENGFYGMNPRFVTHCTCTRKPAYVPKPTYHLYPRSWLHHETTTPLPLDGKLAPPFSKKNKS